jgi:hypothetical protein
MRVLLLKAQADFSEHVRYSGGMHVFRCIAETLVSVASGQHQCAPCAAAVAWLVDSCGCSI